METFAEAVELLRTDRQVGRQAGRQTVKIIRHIMANSHCENIRKVRHSKVEIWKHT